jgi:hypothetical protein
MPPDRLPFPVAAIAGLDASLTFGRDQMLACGPSAAWLDAGRWTPPARPARPYALITGFIEHG